VTRDAGREQQGKVDQRKGTSREGQPTAEAKFFVLDNTLLLILPAKGRNRCLGTNREVRQQGTRKGENFSCEWLGQMWRAVLDKSTQFPSILHKSSGTEVATQANHHSRMVSNKPIPCSKGPSKHVEGHAY